MNPQLWNLSRRAGRLCLDSHDLVDLAARFGTPLHVVSAATLKARCKDLFAAFSGYGGRVGIHYSYKTNPVAGVLRVLHEAGLGAEVVGGYELWLAQRLGVDPARVVFNGANKSDAELQAAVAKEVGLVVVDHPDELHRLETLAAAHDRVVPVALRICPDVKPRGINIRGATGSRRNAFGLDPSTGEVRCAIRHAARSPHLRLRGTMAHIGSGIRHLAAFRQTVDCLVGVLAEMALAGASPDLLDLGGGLGTRLSREMSLVELALCHGLGRPPTNPKPAPKDLFRRYGHLVCETVTRACRRHDLPLPEIVLEPGRAITSDAQVLLLGVGAVRERRGVGRFVVVDGGAMTTGIMPLVEYHGVFLANREASPAGRATVLGRLPTPLDLLYRGLPLPPLVRGDVLAVMDSGAYFTSTSTNFGGPRPAVVLLDGNEARLTRRRESYADLSRVEEDLDS